jgi:prepilin peptidase CpaA
VIVAGFTDLAYGKVYNWCTLPALAAGLLLAYWTGGVNDVAEDPQKTFNLVQSGYGLLLAGGIFGVFFALGAFGAGDLKLAAAIGALNGWRFALVAIVYSSLVGGVLALGVLIWKGQVGRGLVDAAKMALRPWKSKKTVGPDSPARLTVPYGFAISVGTLWAWFFFYVH